MTTQSTMKNKSIPPIYTKEEIHHLITLENLLLQLSDLTGNKLESLENNSSFKSSLFNIKNILINRMSDSKIKYEKNDNKDNINWEYIEARVAYNWIDEIIKLLYCPIEELPLISSKYFQYIINWRFKIGK